MKVARMFLIHIGRTFPTRVAEWYLAAVLFSWGLVLVLPENTFDRGGAYEWLSSIAPEYYWGLGFIALGGLRLIALAINGYWVPATYHLRSVFSFLSVFAWLYITYGMFTAGYWTTGMASYTWKIALELFCLYRTARDYRVALTAHNAGTLS